MSDLLKETIQSKIFSIRGLQVMLDKDLAKFYEVKPFRLREQVKQNTDRFPTDFIFQLNDSEVDLLVSQNAIPFNTLTYIKYCRIANPAERCFFDDHQRFEGFAILHGLARNAQSFEGFTILHKNPAELVLV